MPAQRNPDIPFVERASTPRTRGESRLRVAASIVLLLHVSALLAPQLVHVLVHHWIGDDCHHSGFTDDRVEGGRGSHRGHSHQGHSHRGHSHRKLCHHDHTHAPRDEQPTPSTTSPSAGKQLTSNKLRAPCPDDCQDPSHHHPDPGTDPCPLTSSSGTLFPSPAADLRLASLDSIFANAITLTGLPFRQYLIRSGSPRSPPRTTHPAIYLAH